MAMTDAQWTALAPLVEACRPRSKRPPRDLRRTLDGIFWRHRNGATWRAVPAEYGPWWRAAQLFIRWSRLGAWQRLLGLAQARGVELGLAFLDGSMIRAHPKAAGARKRGPAARSVNAARRSGARVAASARKPASSPTVAAGRSPSP
jgi:transposase